MSFTIAETPWVALRKGDPSFQLQGSLTLTNRAGIQINQGCPSNIASNLNWAIAQGFIEAVAYVPKDDTTLMWETLNHD